MVIPHVLRFLCSWASQRNSCHCFIFSTCSLYLGFLTFPRNSVARVLVLQSQILSHLTGTVWLRRLSQYKASEIADLIPPQAYSSHGPGRVELE
ncbi:hypothetical protein MPTK1_2g07710 [Marchantia polymorpha subsp. ruderalis]|uniref:Uncharacterized protein n=1 Tax=Marchantia polymorpha TaxID=3197 RepID=A0A2R6XGR1_MARPO|nr:hypothetical protein MARPO_0015s0057 [Marchantia polymorpha]BBN01482.1 hypothetical protein Mp_2g07710 [Marchantia polymorpha subsp. ruderalis]|eukprot:PTQ45249.1 hypothetical protein MARPO_0015s0057 [Marchantia polymorpha]